MKKKRIVLHVVALALALACMVCVALGTLKLIDVNNNMTGEEAEEQYCNHYIQGVEGILGYVYEQLDYKNIYGSGDNEKIEDVKVPSGWLLSGMYYTIMKEAEEGDLKLASNYSGKTDELKENICVFNENGLSMEGEQAHLQDFVWDRVESYINNGTFYYENGDVEVSFDELANLCKKNKFYIEIYTLQNDDIGVYIYDLGDDVQLGVTQSQKDTWMKEAVIYYIVAGVLALIALIPYIWLLVIAGHKEKGDKPQLQKIDNLWMDVVLVAAVSIYAIAILLAGDMLYDGANVADEIVFGVWIFITMLAVEAVLQISESIVRRLKTKSFIKTTLIGKICIAAKRTIIKIIRNMKLSVKIIVMCIALEIILLIDYALVEMWANSIVMALCIIAIPVVIIGEIVWNYYKEKEIIIEETEKIAGGQVDHKIYDPMKFPSNKKLVNAVNGVGEGFRKAVSSNLKNERMKTELITNVSHDLKTPLTSIINYVDLLKTDGLDGEKAPEYLDVLDRKSQRLKTLTEDLVEASKLNSGVIELDVKDIDIVQLVNQSLAEYSERFEKSGLHIIKNITRDTIIVKADGRKTWRALDNLYSNVCKYAMPGTRVYIDIFDEESNAVVSIKNISAGALNFSADELMERFVRGDVSRTTEGSGLGLSIAKSIMERQNGELKITLDGDLFKVEMKLMK